MTARAPSTAFAAVSSIHHRVHHRATLRHVLIAGRLSRTPIRLYSTPPATKEKDQKDDLDRPEKSALVAIQGLRPLDPINPPPSTRPQPLELPTRGSETVALYLYRQARAYGKFYWIGIKAVWFNYQAARLIRARIKNAGKEDEPEGKMLGLIKRSELQILERNQHDIGKLPFFGVLVALLGEWLVFIVPFMPGVVPGTCAFPKQLEGMRKSAEERRRVSFRRGISEPDDSQTVREKYEFTWPMIRQKIVASQLGNLRYEQLFHISCTLNVHNRLWDRVNLSPPSWLLRRGLARRLTYLVHDDYLLLRDRGDGQKLDPDEAAIACEQRGLDVLGKKHEAIYDQLDRWLGHQQAGGGSPSSLVHLLFRRPNAWAKPQSPNVKAETGNTADAAPQKKRR